MWQNTEGIVLRTVKCAGGSVILDVYTALRGRAQYSIGKGSRTRTCRGAANMPLSLIELEADVRPHTSVQRLKELKLCYSPLDYPFHPVKCAVAIFISELLVRVLKEEEPNPALYAFLRESIFVLDHCQRGMANFHLAFMLRLARYLGIFPNLLGYAPGALFSLSEAEYLSPQGSDQEGCLPADESRWLPLLSRMHYQNMHRFVMNRDQRNRCLSLMMDYYHHHLPGMGTVRSVEVLQQLFV